tara:strand:- start:3877 stop:4155 length:279 start_codon:yes stop_codon:yes gene_type:complete
MMFTTWKQIPAAWAMAGSHKSRGWVVIRYDEKYWRLCKPRHYHKSESMWLVMSEDGGKSLMSLAELEKQLHWYGVLTDEIKKNRRNPKSHRN